MDSLISNLKNIDEQSKKKLMLFGIGFVVVIILIIIISIVVSIVTRKTSYEDMETIMEEAAYKYYQQNLGQLPTADVKTSVVSAQTLVEQEYMKEISKYTKDESCSGNVIVTYVDGDYDYQGYLMCNDFNTSLLVDKIKKDNSIVTTGAGLYDESGILRFRGEHINNYLKIGEYVYRIIKIDKENKIYITRDEMDYFDDTLRIYWDDRYNSEDDLSSGINDYSVSRARESLNGIYESFDKELKSYLVSHDICVNKRAETDTTNDGSIECGKVIENQKISLLPVYEYIKGSIAASCVSIKSKECKNYNYLVIEDIGWWTLTADSNSSSYIYYVNSTGEIDKDKGNNGKVARYVLTLKSNVLFKSGNGTEESPYEIR